MTKRQDMKRCQSPILDPSTTNTKRRKGVDAEPGVDATELQEVSAVGVMDLPSAVLDVVMSFIRLPSERHNLKQTCHLCYHAMKQKSQSNDGNVQNANPFYASAFYVYKVHSYLSRSRYHPHSEVFYTRKASAALSHLEERYNNFDFEPYGRNPSQSESVTIELIDWKTTDVVADVADCEWSSWEHGTEAGKEIPPDPVPDTKRRMLELEEQCRILDLPDEELPDPIFHECVEAYEPEDENIEAGLDEVITLELGESCGP